MSIFRVDRRIDSSAKSRLQISLAGMENKNRVAIYLNFDWETKTVRCKLASFCCGTTLWREEAYLSCGYCGNTIEDPVFLPPENSQAMRPIENNGSVRESNLARLEELSLRWLSSAFGDWEALLVYGELEKLVFRLEKLLLEYHGKQLQLGQALEKVAEYRHPVLR